MKKYRLLITTLVITLVLVTAKWTLHALGWEGIALGSLHTSVVAGALFVIGFLLSANIADYKESEKIPAEFAATAQNMYEDAATVHAQYPKFAFGTFKENLVRILGSFKEDVRAKSLQAHREIHQLNHSFASMEQAGVPANFIVKFKQEQSLLTKQLFRVNYIQNIVAIPSSFILAGAITVLAISLLLFTEVEPFYGGLVLVGIISFILLYILQLIALISTPFHGEGKTQDDVSMFLIDQAAEHIRRSDASS